MSLEQKLKSKIRDIPDYPKPGIVFKDIAPVLADPLLVGELLEAQISHWKGRKIDVVAAVEARGFIFGGMLARELNCPFVPVRKLGKLPYKTLTHEYSLEYGTAAIEIHIDAVQTGQRVLVHDDLLATGGTAIAAGELIGKLGGEIAGFGFLINLAFLPGKKKIMERFGIEPYYLAEY